MRKRSILILCTAWMLLLVAGVSSAVTMALCGAFDKPDVQGGPVEVDYEQYRSIERYARLDEVRRTLSENYYTALDEDALVLGAIRGMMDAVDDPYTFYYTTEEMRGMTEHTQGLYEGVGLLLSSDKTGALTVLRVFRDSPAYEAGVLPGDVITSINGEAVSAQTSKALSDAIDRIKNSAETLFMLTLRRGDGFLTVGMTRSAVAIDRVEYKVLPGGIGYIAIYEFMGDDVSGFRKAARALQQEAVQGLILDVRSNPGGLLTDVVEIANQLMGEGLIVYTEDREGKRSEYFSDAAMWDVPIAVLVNGMSASASEILAGALQDTGRAVVVGETTYGKGIVQTVIPFRSDGAGMQLTTATYYTPSGRSIHEKGITPDLRVDAGISANTVYVQPDLSRDTQLKAAYDALVKRVKEAKKRA